jgi:hypothetical protein
MKLWQYVTKSRPFGCSAKVQEVKQVSEYDLAITADPSCIACWGAERLLVPRYSNETAISQCGNQRKCYLPTETNLGGIGLHRSAVMFRTEDEQFLGSKLRTWQLFGIWRRVVSLKNTDVSEVRTAFIIGAITSETSVYFNGTTRRYMSESYHNRRRENLKTSQLKICLVKLIGTPIC